MKNTMKDLFMIVIMLFAFSFANTSLANQTTADKVSRRAEAFHRSYVEGKFGNITSLASEYMGQMGGMVIHLLNAQSCHQAQEQLPLMDSRSYIFVIDGKNVELACTSRSTSAAVNLLF